MKAKMILLLFVMGVILGGCSVKSNKDILLDDTKTIIKYSPYQKMFHYSSAITFMCVGLIIN